MAYDNESSAGTETGRKEPAKWRFGSNDNLYSTSTYTVRGSLNMLMDSLNQNDTRTVVPLAHGDPSAFPCFRPAVETENAVIDAVRTAKFNHYSSTVGILPARRAIAEYLSKDLPYTLSPDDVFLTIGCNQALEAIISVLARPGANILLPRPGFPYYESRASFSKLEVRHFDLLPDKGWEVDLEAVEKLADENTSAMVVINPGNPTGSVYSYEHLKKIAELARKLGIMVIADEVYNRLAFGDKPFIPMGVFGSMAPILTLGSISKRWMVPGWRLGWLVTTDPNGFFTESGLVKSIKAFMDVSVDPATVIQGAASDIIQKTPDEFFSRIMDLLKRSAGICYEKINEIPCITCPHKPEGSMFVMVNLNVSMLEDIKDDMDFCLKLANEESVVVMPGIVVGKKNWLRVTFAIEPAPLEEGLKRMKAFCERHAKKK